jgi:hypothetical protein
MCSFVTQHNTHVLRERATGMLTAGMSIRAVASELNVNFSTLSHLQHHFGEFGSTSNWPHNLRPRVWRRVDDQFADIYLVNRVPHGGSGAMVWAGINYGQQTRWPFE